MSEETCFSQFQFMLRTKFEGGVEEFLHILTCDGDVQVKDLAEYLLSQDIDFQCKDDAFSFAKKLGNPDGTINASSVKYAVDLFVSSQKDSDMDDEDFNFTADSLIRGISQQNGEDDDRFSENGQGDDMDRDNEGNILPDSSISPPPLSHFPVPDGEDSDDDGNLNDVSMLSDDGDFDSRPTSPSRAFRQPSPHISTGSRSRPVRAMMSGSHGDAQAEGDDDYDDNDLGGADQLDGDGEFQNDGDSDEDDASDGSSVDTAGVKHSQTVDSENFFFCPELQSEVDPAPTEVAAAALLMVGGDNKKQPVGNKEKAILTASSQDIDDASALSPGRDVFINTTGDTDENVGLSLTALPRQLHIAPYSLEPIAEGGASASDSVSDTGGERGGRQKDDDASGDLGSDTKSATSDITTQSQLSGGISASTQPKEVVGVSAGHGKEGVQEETGSSDFVLGRPKPSTFGDDHMTTRGVSAAAEGSVGSFSEVTQDNVTGLWERHPPRHDSTSDQLQKVFAFGRTSYEKAGNVRRSQASLQSPTQRLRVSSNQVSEYSRKYSSSREAVGKKDAEQRSHKVQGGHGQGAKRSAPCSLAARDGDEHVSVGSGGDGGDSTEPVAMLTQAPPEAKKSVPRRERKHDQAREGSDTRELLRSDRKCEIWNENKRNSPSHLDEKDEALLIDSRPGDDEPMEQAPPPPQLLLRASSCGMTRDDASSRRGGVGRRRAAGVEGQRRGGQGQMFRSGGLSSSKHPLESHVHVLEKRIEDLSKMNVRVSQSVQKIEKLLENKSKLIDDVVLCEMDHLHHNVEKLQAFRSKSLREMQTLQASQRGAEGSVASKLRDFEMKENTRIIEYVRTSLNQATKDRTRAEAKKKKNNHVRLINEADPSFIKQGSISRLKNNTKSSGYGCCPDSSSGKRVLKPSGGDGSRSTPKEARGARVSSSRSEKSRKPEEETDRAPADEPDHFSTYENINAEIDEEEEEKYDNEDEDVDNKKENLVPSSSLVENETRPHRGRSSKVSRPKLDIVSDRVRRSRAVERDKAAPAPRDKAAPYLVKNPRERIQDFCFEESLRGSGSAGGDTLDMDFANKVQRRRQLQEKKKHALMISKRVVSMWCDVCDEDQNLCPCSGGHFCSDEYDSRGAAPLSASAVSTTSSWWSALMAKKEEAERRGFSSVIGSTCS